MPNLHPSLYLGSILSTHLAKSDFYVLVRDMRRSEVAMPEIKRGRDQRRRIEKKKWGEGNTLAKILPCRVWNHFGYSPNPYFPTHPCFSSQFSLFLPPV